MANDATRSDTPHLAQSLSLWSVVLFGLAFMALTTVFSTFGIASSLSKGMVAGSYILAMIVMLFTAYSYGVMAKRFPMTGSAYSYVQKVIRDRKSTRLNSSHVSISYAVFCLKKKNNQRIAQIHHH